MGCETLLPGTALATNLYFMVGAPVRMGHSHAIYNPGECSWYPGGRIDLTNV